MSLLGKCVDCEREANTHNVNGDPSCMPCAAKRHRDSDAWKTSQREQDRVREADAIVRALANLHPDGNPAPLTARARLYVEGK